EDLELINEFFTDPCNVFLIVRSPEPDGPPAGAFFFWDQGQVWGDFTFMPFPFDATLLPCGERSGRAESIAEDVPTETSAVLPAAATPFRFRRVGLWGAVGLSALLALSAALYWPRRTTPLPQRRAASVALSLAVTRSGSDVSITWNSASAAIKDARVGVL